MVSRHRYPDCIALIELLVSQREVDYPLLEVVKHADLQCTEGVLLLGVTQDIGNMSTQVEFSVNMVRQEFGISCLAVGIAERSI
jgi:hypothetical protein